MLFVLQIVFNIRYLPSYLVLYIKINLFASISVFSRLPVADYIFKRLFYIGDFGSLVIIESVTRLIELTTIKVYIHCHTYF